MNISPSSARVVAFITVISKGIRIGNDSTGYKVPFVFAFAMIAAIMVAAAANPRLPRTMVSVKTAIDLMRNAGKAAIYNTVTADERTSVKPLLKMSFPKY